MNKIVTLFPKDARGVINWFNLGKATNIDKEKALHFIEALQNHFGTTITNEELSNAAKIVEDFPNPKLSNGNLQNVTENNSTKGLSFSLRQSYDSEGSFTHLGALALSLGCVGHRTIVHRATHPSAFFAMGKGT